MQPDFDVVIVGGGAAGIGSARHLTGKGLSVRLLESSAARCIRLGAVQVHRRRIQLRAAGRGRRDSGRRAAEEALASLGG